MIKKILYLSRAYTHEPLFHETFVHKVMNQQLIQKPERKSAVKNPGLCSQILPFLNEPLLILPILTLLGVISLQTAAAEDGAALHEENCTACHAAMTGGEGTVLYTRDDRMVQTSDTLTKQVNRCQSSLGLAWSNDQINSVQQYLNRSFYSF